MKWLKKAFLYYLMVEIRELDTPEGRIIYRWARLNHHKLKKNESRIQKYQY
ncbi:hypothetical protein Phi4:1_gp158 [Cellulophaga phage phi4:1]|uniref:Uncharacterized protein n=5 Tax=Lightbulbvirus TaxID=1918522 RepID=A0A0S2MWW8_9CAUD|nr:hypothetical protein Phi4:1_gp158 [Cellulophaga phage phi4:1]YP_008241657.1 hypothetical protein Phi17:2_gp162 [Cellulophaga phage phi17:2]ALO80167.1 hypothetical protein Phi4113_158 [Cellulophaga phage phi4:1_13]ALO80364.1 hypothetical protein Phi4118_158 [Cellulophaga phage phi4:1_18]ALO80565.1 hypothetical protein Phi17218_162 [Cellulophaga phage phi17:2_18]AGO47695.1 hypothetical protein Phi17:2_gp162 [Cellulophaga phage phi17:2]AGO49571.1 hypothetical protein Phi4:1_gp158 [Cellulophag